MNDEQRTPAAVPSLDTAEGQGDEERLQALEATLERLERDLENDGAKADQQRPL